MAASSNSALPPELVAKRRIASVTVDGVARLARISATTVSWAIHYPELLSPATRAKLQAAIAEAGYVPNLVAGGLRSSKSRLAAALAPTFDKSGVPSNDSGATAALNDHGYPAQYTLFPFEFGLTY